MTAVCGTAPSDISHEQAAEVRREVQAVIGGEGAFTVSGDLAALVCR